MYNNPKHFLHKYLNFLESTGIEGKDNGFEKFFENKGVKFNKNWVNGTTVIDWSLIEPKFKFFYDFEGGENEIQNWLTKSKLTEFEFVYTWFDYNDPIVKIKTTEFITNWEQCLIGAVEGMSLITENGEVILEFTGSSEYQLWSNFEIKP